MKRLIKLCLLSVPAILLLVSCGGESDGDGSVTGAGDDDAAALVGHLLADLDDLVVEKLDLVDADDPAPG